MNRVTLLLLALIPSTACLVVSGYLAVHGMEGWGWFLFVGLLLGQTLAEGGS